VYNPVNLSIQSSKLFEQGHWVLHILLCLAYLSVGISNIPYVLPLIALQLGYVWHWRRSGFAYNQPRQWRFFQGQAQRLMDGQWQSMDIKPQQIWPSFLLFQYRKVDSQLAWQWECIAKDACEAEAFRQTVAVMKTEF